ncbi:MAG: cyclodeaminase/cyclohydrolase family protein [Synergistaceae bacterium]|jgi:glutamate formiminotransferase/formiminotetrahydrofolate cyclodeaminase|nr:cyclodeaminase/cyclohydrolase family protein [Synergistaceae bacterium]
MAFEQETIQAFLDKLAGKSPAPGGGSSAALAGAIGAALVSMVAALTAGNDKFAESREFMTEMHKASESLMSRLIELMNEDTEAFNEYMAALKMPKSSDSEKSARKSAIATASLRITEVPLATLELSAKVAALAARATELGNPNAASDAGSAALLAEAAGRAAAYNVRINLSSIKDEIYAGEVRKKLRRNLDEIERRCRVAEKAMDEILEK